MFNNKIIWSGSCMQTCLYINKKNYIMETKFNQPNKWYVDLINATKNIDNDQSS